MIEEKLVKLAAIEGYDMVEDLIDDNAMDSVVPGICMNDECDYTTGVEPDSTEGWCECCEDNTVRSCLSLAGII